MCVREMKIELQPCLLLVELAHGKGEVRGFLGKHTREAIVPSNDGSDHTKGTTSNLGWDASIVFGSGKQDKGDQKHEEQKHHANG